MIRWTKVYLIFCFMNSKNTSNNIFEGSIKNLTIAFRQLFIKDEVEEIIMDKTRISHLRPEDIILSKNTAFIVQKKEEKSDKDILYELLLRSNKKQSKEDINKSIRILYDRQIDIHLMKELWRLSKHYFTDELEKKWFFDLFDIIFNETIPNATIDKKIEEFNNELSKKVAKSKDEILKDNFFDEIYMPEIFNAEEYLDNINKLKKEQKKEAIEKFYLNYKKQLGILASISDKIKEKSKKYDFLTLSNEEIIKFLILNIKKDFFYLSTEQRIDIIKKIEIYLNIRRDIIYYLENPQYTNKHKKILANIYNIPQDKLEWWFFCEDWDTCLVFYIQDKNTFANLFNNFSDNSDLNIATKLVWFYSIINNVPISIINWTFFNYKSEIIKLHEVKHSENNIIINDVYKDYLTIAKDEIIAYLKDWSNTLEDIKKMLIEKESSGWWYDYYSHQKHSIYYNEIRKYYEKDLGNAIQIAKYMKELNIPNYLEILAIMPVRKWHILKKIY